MMLEITLEGRLENTDVGFAVGRTSVGRILVGSELKMLEMTDDGSSVKIPEGKAVEKTGVGMIEED